MKKITALIMMALLITIGGVYATWIYAGTELDPTHMELSHSLEGAVQEGSIGTYIIDTNSVMIKIDQTASNDYTAVLKVSGEMTISFTPATGASQEVLANGVPSHAYFIISGADENKYPDKNGVDQPIYVTAGENSISLVWNKQEDGSFSATITADQIDGILNLGGEFYLDTIEEYRAFDDKEKIIDLDLYIAQK